MWEPGGQKKIKPLWRHYYQDKQAIIFVVDSNDRERIEPQDHGGDILNEILSASDDEHNAKTVLWEVLGEDELRNVPLLVFANKQDLPNAMSVNEITEKLGLNEIRDRKWWIQVCCATTGDGLYEGLDFLHNIFKKKKESD